MMSAFFNFNLLFKGCLTTISSYFSIELILFDMWTGEGQIAPTPLVKTTFRKPSVITINGTLLS